MSPGVNPFCVISVYLVSAGDVLPSGDMRAANVDCVEPSINDTYTLSCLRAPILKPCSLYGGFVASDV